MEYNDDNNVCNSNSAEENLTFALNLIEEQEELKEEAIILCRNFIEDVHSRLQDFDIQYLTGLKTFFTTYLDTVKKVEPLNSATPRLASLLHTSFSSKRSSSQMAGTRQIKVQPTAISRRSSSLSKGNKLAPSGDHLSARLTTLM